MRHFVVVTFGLLTGVFLFSFAYGFCSLNHYHDSSLSAFKCALDQGTMALAFSFFPICWIGLVVVLIARIVQCFRAPTLNKESYIWTAFYSVVLVLLLFLCPLPYWLFLRLDSPAAIVDALFAALVCLPTTMVLILRTVQQKRLARQLSKETLVEPINYPMESENSWFKGHHHPWLSLAIGFCAAGGYAFATDLYWYHLERDIAFTIMVGPVATSIVYVLVAVLQCLFDFMRYVFYKSET